MDVSKTACTLNRAALELELEKALQEFLSRADPSQHTSDLPDHIVAAMVELESQPDESSDTDDPTDRVHAPVKPRPHLNSGAAVLPEPD
jgi:hypothetical protein